MLQYEELILEFEGLKPQLIDLKAALNVDGLKKDIAALEEETARPDFWNDPESSQKISQKLGALKAKAAQYDKLSENYDDVLTMAELANEEEDESMLPEIRELADKTKSMLEEMKLVTLLSGEFDSKNAILTFHAGAGGTEAQDWVEMLYRMYNRWAENHNFKVSLLDYLEGEEAGIKSASILIEGINAYGFLKSENGVHRLVRVSPFDASGRRHTSFASLEVMPEIDDDTSVEIRPEDIELVPRGKGTLPGVVTNVIFKGVHYEMDVEAGGYEWLVHSTRLNEVGSEVDISVDPFNIQVMNKPESEDEEALSVEDA